MTANASADQGIAEVEEILDDLDQRELNEHPDQFELVLEKIKSLTQ